VLHDESVALSNMGEKCVVKGVVYPELAGSTGGKKYAYELTQSSADFGNVS
jgi:hypothetical protein